MRYTKMIKYLKTIEKSVLVAGLATAPYFVGLKQNPSFDKLPTKAQQVIVDQHRDADNLLTRAVDEYKRGDPKKAEELYWQFKKEETPLKNIDTHYEELETLLFRYSAAIIDTADIVTKYIEHLYEHVVAGTPEKIAEYVTASGIGWGDSLENIGPESGAYHRLNEDKAAQTALLKYYVDCSLRWYNAQEQMRETLKSSPHKTEQIDEAIRILDKRMEQIKIDRERINQFEEEQKKR